MTQSPQDPLTVATNAIDIARKAVRGCQDAIQRQDEWLTILEVVLPAVDEARLPDDDARASLAEVRQVLPTDQAYCRELQELMKTHAKTVEEFQTLVDALKAKRR